jgi:hypothetical protein
LTSFGDSGITWFEGGCVQSVSNFGQLGCDLPVMYQVIGDARRL